jgi:hypothetical protein
MKVAGCQQSTQHGPDRGHNQPSDQAKCRAAVLVVASINDGIRRDSWGRAGVIPPVFNFAGVDDIVLESDCKLARKAGANW